MRPEELVWAAPAAGVAAHLVHRIAVARGDVGIQLVHRSHKFAQGCQRLWVLRSIRYRSATAHTDATILLALSRHTAFSGAHLVYKTAVVLADVGIQLIASTNLLRAVSAYGLCISFTVGQLEFALMQQDGSQ